MVCAKVPAVLLLCVAKLVQRTYSTGSIFPHFPTLKSTAFSCSFAFLSFTMNVSNHFFQSTNNIVNSCLCDTATLSSATTVAQLFTIFVFRSTDSQGDFWFGKTPTVCWQTTSPTTLQKSHYQIEVQNLDQSVQNAKNN